MRRPWLILIFCLLAGILAWWELRLTNSAESEKISTAKILSESESAAKASMKPTLSVNDVPMVPASERERIMPQNDSQTGPRFKRAYMLSLDQGKLAFLEAQDIEGDFAKPRRKPEEWSGMLRCRLMSESNAVLAEELLPAPDHLCAVIDPKSGYDKPVQYTVAGPVTFQVRLPRVKGAVRLDISRIIQPADSTQPGLEGQLGSILLPRS